MSGCVLPAYVTFVTKLVHVKIVTGPYHRSFEYFLLPVSVFYHLKSNKGLSIDHWIFYSSVNFHTSRSLNFETLKCTRKWYFHRCRCLFLETLRSCRLELMWRTPWDGTLTFLLADSIKNVRTRSDYVRYGGLTWRGREDAGVYFDSSSKSSIF